MGTRADFYVGRGITAEWIGSIAWDGYPEAMPPALLRANSEAHWRNLVSLFLRERDDATLPDQGWPWPWENGHLTDYSYAFDGETVWASNYGSAWWRAQDVQPESDEDDAAEQVPFPDMTARQKVTLGKRSGVIVVGPHGPETPE